jgi:hypothetical protein
VTYLYMRRALLTSLATQLDWVETERATAERVTGNQVTSWRNVYSPGAGMVTFTSWWGKLSALEAATDALRNDNEYRDITEAGGTVVEGTIDEELFHVIHGDIPSTATRYVRTLSAQCSAEHHEFAVAAGVEVAKKAEELIGTSVQFAQSITGSLGLVHWLSGYDSLADLQEAVDKFTGAASGWLYFRDRYNDAFLGPAMKIHLRERLSPVPPVRGVDRA